MHLSLEFRGYQTEKLGQNSTDPVLIKTDRATQNGFCEWNEKYADIDEVGTVAFVAVQLDVNGFGEVTL